MFILRSVAACALAVGMAIGASAAQFFNETGPGLSAEQVAALRGAGVSFTSSEGDEEIVIDDMRFRVADLFTTGFSGNRWTDGKIVYQFDSNVSKENKQKFKEACNVWEQVSAVRCVERSGEPSFVHVVSSSFNRSFVGMIGGRQDLEIYNWGWKFIIAHEIGHALGLSHEQSRSDRDTFVEIRFDNIQDGAENNFQVSNTTNYTDYDFRSIMHYGPTAFSKNGGATIRARPEYVSEQGHMGNRSYLSAADAAGMASRYGAHPVP